MKIELIIVGLVIYHVPSAKKILLIVWCALEKIEKTIHLVSVLRATLNLNKIMFLSDNVNSAVKIVYSVLWIARIALSVNHRNCFKMVLAIVSQVNTQIIKKFVKDVTAYALHVP